MRAWFAIPLYVVEFISTPHPVEAEIVGRVLMVIFTVFFVHGEEGCEVDFGRKVLSRCTPSSLTQM